MAEKFTIADTHFTQPSMLSFAGLDGASPLRPWGRVCDLKHCTDEEKADRLPEFEERAAEMDEAMVDLWNATVPATGAKVYVLGDVVMKTSHLSILGRLNGKKKLIFGNHDPFAWKHYAPYFYDCNAYRIADGIIMSHIPIHEASMNARWKANVHGHLHAERVMMPRDNTLMESISGEPLVINPRYLCVSVEHTGFKPLSFDDMFARIASQQESGVVS